MSPHVLLTTDTVGGVWDFSMTLREQLQRVTVLALGPEPPEAPADTVSAPLKLEWMQDAEDDVQRTIQLVEDLVRDRDIDVVHANQFAAALAQTRAPIVLTLHSDVLSWRRWTLGTSDVPPEWRFYRGLVREAVRRADRVVAVSRFLAEQVQDLYCCRREIEVIHNGWRRMASAPTERNVTLLAGRVWDSAKNIPLAVAAAQSWHPGRVVVAGELSHPETGATMPLQRPLESLGYLAQSELQQWLNRTAIYISPARYDPFGLLPVQAALSGAALLLSDIPSYRELWDGAACFFRADDADDLRRQWQALSADQPGRERLAASAHARALHDYSAQRMVSQYQHLYATVSQAVTA